MAQNPSDPGAALEDISRFLSRDPNSLVNGIRKSRHKTPTMTWMVLINPQINNTFRCRLVDGGILKVLKGVLTDPRISVDSVDESGNPFWALPFIAWHSLTGIQVAASRPGDAVLDAVVKDRDFLRSMLQLFSLHPKSDDDTVTMCQFRTMFGAYLKVMLDSNEPGPNSWVLDMPQCVSAAARIWMLSLNDDDLETEWANAWAFNMALKGASSQHIIPNIDLQRLTGFTYEQLMKKYIRLASRKDLSLPIRMLQLELYASWLSDPSEPLHTMMCKEIPGTVHLLRETTNNPSAYPGICYLAMGLWTLLLGRPSSHQMHDVAVAVAAGLILLVGDWIVDAELDAINDLETLLAQFCKFAFENPVTGVRIAADLDVVAAKVIASPQSPSDGVHAAIARITSMSRRLNESIQILAGECAGVDCWNTGTMLCSGCNIITYCSPRCQKEDWKTNHKMACKTAKIFRGD